MNSKPLYELSYAWLPANDHRPVRCCVCGAADAEREVSYFLLNDERYAIVECTRDNLMFLSPQPGDAYCTALYNHPSYYTGTDDMYGMAMDEEKSKDIARVRVIEALTYAPVAKSFLELGCAYGHVLEAARAAGIERAAGVEYSAGAVELGNKKGVDIRQGSLDSDFAKTFEGERFGVVALYSVLEHLRDPAAFLRKAQGLLAKDGIIIIRVPETPPEGPRLSLLDHFWHFNAQGLGALLDSLGFIIRDSFPSGTFKGIQHEGEVRSTTFIASL